jgi:hypothetical protein
MSQVSFPIWRLRKFQEIKTNVFGLTKVRYIKKGWVIVDDKRIDAESLAERRLQLIFKGLKDELCPLTEKIDLFKDMVKYPSGTVFIDAKGFIFVYNKSSRLNTVESLPIVKYAEIEGYIVFKVKGIPDFPFIIPSKTKDLGTKYASIMHTQYGPILYDITKDCHATFRRKI